MPRPFAILIAFVMALYFVPFSALPASATAPTLKLEGCRADSTAYPPTGPYVCPDGDYIEGNLGKGWNELDLVPFRITSTSSAGDTFPFTTTLAADYKDDGNTGYDFISVPVVNDALSDDSCEITNVGTLQYDQPDLGGADSTIRRQITWTQDAGVVCVFDYYQRLALGAAKYPGANLQAYLGVDTGKKTISIPVQQAVPQQLSKTMTATQGSTYNWTVSKQRTPATVDFANTCLQSTTPKSADVTITVNWTRSAVTASGDVTLTTSITASNPARRNVTVTVTDKMYAGADQSNLLATNSDTHVVPAGTVDSKGVTTPGTYTFEFTEVVQSSASTFNDVATGAYTDTVTGIAIPGTTQATASADVELSGQTSGATATISDVESISGNGFSYKVNSVTPNVGSFNGYTLGTATTGDVTWSHTISPSGTGAASGSFVFAKTVLVAAGTVGSGSLSDIVTLTPAGQTAQTANASIGLTADAADPKLRITKRVDLAPDSDATFTFLVWRKDSGGAKVGDPYTFTVVIPAGQTSATSAYQTVLPSANGYLYEETAATGYTGVNGTVQPLAKCDEHTMTVDNTRDMGKIKIQKVIEGDPAGASTAFTVHVDCPGETYDQNVLLNSANSWVNLTGDIPTGTVCTISEPTVPAGWQLKSISPDSVTVGKGTPTTVSATVTNERLEGSVTINKLLEGAVAGASTEFTVLLDCDVNAYDKTVVLNESNSWTRTYSIPSGVTCEVTEPTVPAGWELKSISPSGEFTVGAGQTVTVDVTNERLEGSVTINKLLEGAVAGASTEFTVLLDCDVNAYDKTVVLNESNSWTRTYSIPSGVTCEVTEPTVPAGWTLKSISPSGEFTVAADQTVTVNVTNKRLEGSLTINKLLEGAVAGASTEFTVLLDCDVDAYDKTVVLNQANSWTKTYGNIPSGVTCEVTEPTVPAGWELKSISPSGEFTVGAGETVTVDVTNKRLEGGIVINKLVEGAVAGASTDFTVLLDCDVNAYDKTVVLNEANSWTKTYSGIPAGVTCQVTEPSVPAGWALKSISPAGEFTVGSGASVVVEVTNVREVGKIKIKKVIEGDVAGADTDFTVRVDCPGTAYDQDVALNEGNGWVNTTGNIPTGLTCTLTEVDVPEGWNPEGWDPEAPEDVLVKTVTVTGSTEEVAAVVTNKRRTGKVEITKKIEGDPAGASTEFRVRLNCDGEDYDQTVVLNEANSWTVTIAGIPSGVECRVVEPTVPAGWELKSITPPGEFEIDSYDTVAVEVVNKRLEGSIVISKLVEGDVAGASTEFTVLLDCDVNTYDKTVVLNESNGWTKSYTIPSGVTCEVTEPTVPAGWTLKSISPSGKFTVGAGTSVVVDVTNVRDVGSVEVKKVVVGDVAGASTDFTVLLDCDGTAYDKTLALNAGNSWTARVDNIPTMVQCQVTEPTVPAGWALTSISPSGKFPVQKTTIASVTVTNTRTTGVISVTKVLDGAANGASTTFTFDVDCPGTAYDQSVVVDVTSGTSATATTKQIPTGLTCTVTERATPDWKLTATVPAGGVVAVGSTVTFTNQRLAGTLNIAKAVSPVAGNGVVVEFGDTLTYTLTVSATGEQRQPNVVVTDYLPGFDPARPKSGHTTYVAGSAACVGAGTCVVTGPGADGLITWALGEMAAGTTRQVTFQVVIDDVKAAAGETVAVDIINAGAVQSDRVPKVPSNEVVTPVTKVMPVKVSQPPKALPRTGSSVQPGPLAGTAVALLGLGLLLMAASRRRTGRHHQRG